MRINSQGAFFSVSSKRKSSPYAFIMIRYDWCLSCMNEAVSRADFLSYIERT